LVAAIDGVMRALAVLREQTIAASSVPPTDDWIGQRESPIPPRCHTRLCRKLMAEGDDRSAVTGRNHLLRRSALDEYLRGMPGRTAATAPHTAANPLSPWEQVKRKWAEAGLQ
jgi:hypothetical protein